MDTKAKLKREALAKIESLAKHAINTINKKPATPYIKQLELIWGKSV